ncbi:uncharacterized protein [Macrobrachium rosenbergii]|uniref:uncharacterized protein n=1 Tax=Macrobrachium rosenbergii TaxID=79674 RepID=UPI0034D6367E
MEADRHGAMQLVFPPLGEDCDCMSNTTATLVAANGSPIRCYGTQTSRISILGHKYEWPFIIVDVKFSLLGADFLAQHGLLVDVGQKHLLDTRTCCSRPLSAGPGMPAVYSISSNKYSALLHKFPDVFKAELHQVPGTQAKHGIHHHITITGLPTHAKLRRLPPKKLQDVKRACTKMERMGVCKKALSPWESPLHMVKKPDSSWRLCGDYRRLNLVTTPDHYPPQTCRT